MSTSGSGDSRSHPSSASSNPFEQMDRDAREMREQLTRIADVELPMGKAPGKAGRKIALRSNFYRTKVAPNMRIIQLDVHIQEDNCVLGKESVKKSDEKRLFMAAFLREKFPAHHAMLPYDGQSSLFYLEKQGILANESGDAGQTIRFQYAPRGTRKRDFTVTLRRVNMHLSNDINAYLNGNMVDLKQDAIQAFDIVFRHRASTDTVTVGRSFFPANQPNRRDIGGGREVWFGYHQSLKAIDGNSGGTLALNIDAAAKAFVKEQLGTEVAMEVFKPRGGEREMADPRFWNDGRRKQLEKYLGKLRFIPEHLKNRDRDYRCTTLSRNGADRETFVNENGRTVNIADYYVQKYKKRLRFPSAPMIQVGTGKNVKYFPLELMRVAPRQPHRGQVDEIMQSNMIRAIADPAPKKQKIIDEMAQRAIKELSPMGELYGAKVSAKMEELNGRVLDAPALIYGNRKTVRANQGAWDARRERFFNAAAIEKWVVIAFQSRMDQRQIGDFANGLCKAAGFEGMRASPPERILNANNDEDMARYFQLCQNNNVRFALVIMPRRDSQIYSMIKEKAELQWGIVTQCVQARNVERANGMFYGNLLQKINTKLGGTNTKIENRIQMFMKPCMVVGLSFSHPAPGSRNPSIVTASFSCDASGTKYFTGKRLQRSRFTLATGIKELFLEGLKGFYKRANGKKPERIIVYRNGASEGELQAVAKLEVEQMKAAFAALPGGYSPKLTVIVVNKRTHTRMFAQNQADQIGKSGNVPSGTVVDTVVTSKSLCDWYLNASQGIQGTSRPVHYTLLHDENNLDADNLQMMTYHLCHAYARCTRTVSIPIPCLYAELMGDRVSRYLQSRGIGSDAGSVNSMDSGRSYESDIESLTLAITKEVGDMFFV